MTTIQWQPQSCRADSLAPLMMGWIQQELLSGSQVDIGAHEYAVGETQDADAPWLPAVYQLLL